MKTMRVPRLLHMEIYLVFWNSVVTSTTSSIFGIPSGTFDINSRNGSTTTPHTTTSGLETPRVKAVSSLTRTSDDSEWEWDWVSRINGEW